MALIFRPRVWFLLVALSCTAMISYALYVQHVLFIDPCPLCVFQRIAFIWIGAVALLACIHNPAATGRWFYAILLALGGMVGIGIAGRHVWLQHLPADQVPDCGMGLNYMLETMPFSDVLTEVFHGSGECAEIDWTLLGMSMPNWSLITYIGLTVITIFVVARTSKTKV